MKKKTRVNQYELPITIKRDEDGYLASCPTWRDCYAQGDTIDEALSEITAVAGSLIELYQEENKTVPLKQIKTQKPGEAFHLNIPLIVSVS
ncbi:MAG: type II toxin-antitoxin system HicB family antitoxin [bacterium]|nr:type II toxin-antitoxin system HicB family antitoxin [bacterium]